MSGGSASRAAEICNAANEVDDEVTKPGNVSVGIAPSAATQALRHEAALSTPSGQQGQDSPPPVAGMKLSHGIPDIPPASGPFDTAATTGADKST